VQDTTPVEHFWLMLHMLGNFGAKKNLYFIFSASLSKKRSRAATFFFFFNKPVVRNGGQNAVE